VFSKVDQIGIVVKDVEKSTSFYEKLLGTKSLPPIEFETGTAKLRVVFFQVGDVQLELIQVLEGETVHSKFLKERGEGLHHLGFFVTDLDKELAALKREGIEVLLRSEALGVVKFAYLDTEATLGIILELLQFG
jgi:methylmalonyl-CoA epimerase